MLLAGNYRLSGSWTNAQWKHVAAHWSPEWSYWLALQYNLQQSSQRSILSLASPKNYHNFQQISGHITSPKGRCLRWPRCYPLLDRVQHHLGSLDFGVYQPEMGQNFGTNIQWARNHENWSLFRFQTSFRVAGNIDHPAHMAGISFWTVIYLFWVRLRINQTRFSIRRSAFPSEQIRQISANKFPIATTQG